MRAVRNTADGICVVELPSPEGPGVRLRPRSVGICGSDLHLLGFGPRPITFGHEIGAIAGARPVALQPFAFCGACDPCGRAIPHLCVNTRSNLYGTTCDGGMADELIVDPSCLVELPPGIGVEAASLVEPIAVAVHAVGLGAIAPGMRTAVIGGGTVGQLTGVTAADAGAAVDIATRHEAQRVCAERLGLHVGVTKGYDVVFDAAGSDTSLTEAMKLVRPGGTVVVPAIFWDDVRVPGLALSLKEIRIVPSIYYGTRDGVREVDIAAGILGRKPDLADALITHRFPIERAAEAFAAAASREAGAIKVVVDIDG